MTDGKESTCNAKELGSVPGLGRSPGGGHGNPLIFLPAEFPWTEELGGLWSIVSQSWIQLSDEAHSYISLLISSISPWVSFGKLCFYEFVYFTQVICWYIIIPLLLMSPHSFLSLGICNFFFVTLARSLPILWIFSQDQLLISILYFLSTLTSVVFLLLALGCWLFFF